MKFELLGRGECGIIVPWILNISKVYGVLFEPQNNILLGKDEQIITTIDRQQNHFIYQNDEWDDLKFAQLVNNISDCCQPEIEDGTSIVLQTVNNEHKIRLNHLLFIKPEYVKSGPGGYQPTLVIEMIEKKRERIHIGYNYMDLIKHVHEQLEQAQKFPGKQIVIEI